jgi:hypothetical protein
MPTTIYAYTKHSTPYTIIQATLPSVADAEPRCTELCTIDGITYLSVPDGVTLPDQPPEIELTPVTLSPELREQIKAASPHAQLISERMIQKIRAQYSVDDEMFFPASAWVPPLACTCPPQMRWLTCRHSASL